MKRIDLLKLVISIILFGAFHSAYATKLCSMTFNSSDEKKVMSSVYGEAYELVPDNKDPNWIKKACNAPVKCDVLLVSGHFGGVFFGEKTSPTLDLKTLENLSCNQKCPSIDNAQSVFLMGCNTLATKQPDSRSIDQYLHVLVQDGFPRYLAEEVASSRYLDYGLSLEDRMKLAFPNAKVLYGFSSKGPLGAEAAPRLKKALSNARNDNVENRLLSAFEGTSFSIARPQSLGSIKRNQSCQLRSQDSLQRRHGYQELFKNNSFKEYFDQLINNSDDPELVRTWKQTEGEASQTQFLEVADLIEKNSSSLVGIKAKILKLKLNFEIISRSSYLNNLDEIFQSTIENGLDYLSTDQLCQIAKSDPQFVFKAQWLNSQDENKKSYLARLRTCFKNVDQGVNSIFHDWIFQSNNSFILRESLRASLGTWSSSEWNGLLKHSQNWTARDRSELRLETNQSCKVINGKTPTERDNNRWNCFQKLLPTISSITNCQKLANEFETQISLGVDWACLDHFKNEYSITACLEAANHYSHSNELKYNPEKADDFLFHCSDELRSQGAINRSECLGLTQSMINSGNQIKQNWNCMNQLNQ